MTHHYCKINSLTTHITDNSSAVRLFTMVDGYDSVGRLTTQIDYNFSNTALITMIDTYDSVGNRTGRNQDGTISSWTYDAGYRLVSQIQSGARATYTYDNAGNITTKWNQGANPITIVYDAANRITTYLQGSTLETFTYDANGNLLVDQPGALYVTYTYDHENRMTNLVWVNGTPRSTYTYDGDGLRRTHRLQGAALTTVIWDGDDYLQERSTTTVDYTTILGEIVSENRNGAKRDYVPDPLGSTVYLLDSSQTKTDSYSYWPYGEAKSHSGSSVTPFDWLGTWGYYREPSLRFYVRARYYLQNAGRWQTEDPIGFAGGRNMYQYVASNPVTMLDPSGLFPCWICEVLGTTNPLGWCWTHCENGRNRPKPPRLPKPQPIDPSCKSFVCPTKCSWWERRSPGAHMSFCKECADACAVWCPQSTEADPMNGFSCILCCLARKFNCEINGGNFTF